MLYAKRLNFYHKNNEKRPFNVKDYNFNHGKRI